jgi:methylated-DNA-[protein]-cysteine S-methyltransferase
VALDLTGVSPFHAQVYDAARAIAWGQTASYGELARRVGAPGAARAVGQAMGRNPVPIIIPCHRVLASGHKLGGFSAFGGAGTKQRLLALEGVSLGGDQPCLPGLPPERR